jgi:hypothetical protein
MSQTALNVAKRLKETLMSPLYVAIVLNFSFYTTKMNPQVGLKFKGKKKEKKKGQNFRNVVWKNECSASYTLIIIKYYSHVFRNIRLINGAVRKQKFIKYENIKQR